MKLVFLTTAIVAIAATVAEIEGVSTFREICLAKEVQKVSRNETCYTVQRLLKHVSQRHCTQVSAKKFQRVTAALFFRKSFGLGHYPAAEKGFIY